MKKTILLVEDNPDHVLLALRAMKEADVEAETIVVNDGEEALSFLAGKKGSDLPHFMLLDLGLPGIGGLEVLKSIRQSSACRDLPVVILSTSDEESDKLTGYDLGVNSYILKPVDFKRFVHVVKRVTEYWLEINETNVRRKSL